MKMTIGKFAGQSVDAMSTPYLAWLVSQDNLRYKHWALIREALRVLARRFENFDELVAELKVDAEPPAHWKSPGFEERRERERAEKLRLLEARRAVQKQLLAVECSRRARQKQPDPNDISDLL
jgi:uncharacterized coiled-coil protein SlyX